MSTKNIDLRKILPAVAFEIAKAIGQAKGKSFLVGGIVRDILLHKHHQIRFRPKDIDIEVFGLTEDQLLAVLRTFGQVELVGRSFPVFNLRIGSDSFDFSLPRTERKTGDKHTDFEIVCDPFLSEKEAALRRDFTINAIMVNLLTGEMLDFFNGEIHIIDLVLHPVSDKFKEDPLRVLRAMQFIARFNLHFSLGLLGRSMGLLDEFKHLSTERVAEEFGKFLVKGINHELGFDFLIACGWNQHFAIDFENSKMRQTLDKMVKLRIKDEHQKLIIGLALILMANPAHRTFINDVFGKMPKIVREIEEIQKIRTSLPLGTDITVDLRQSIGVNIKHCSLDTIKLFFKAFVDWKTAEEIEWDTITEENIKPLISGKDLIDAGWNPQRDKELFGRELGRLHLLQLEDINLTKEDLVGQIQKPVV